MRILPAIPLTKENFEQEYKISTGLNFITVNWIEKNKPENKEDRPKFFVKLIRNIQLNQDRWGDSHFIKYGRFRIYKEYPDLESESDLMPKTLEDCEEVDKRYVEPSALVQMIEDIVMDGFDTQYLLDNTGIYLLTDDGQKILIQK